MAKIVYNNQFGGFGLSDKAYRRYAELKGLTLYPEQRDKWTVDLWLDPPEQRKRRLLYHGDIKRHDPILVKVVEELGEEANGECATLAIEEAEEGMPYEIKDFDGRETVVLGSQWCGEIASSYDNPEDTIKMLEAALQEAIELLWLPPSIAHLLPFQQDQAIEAFKKKWKK